MTASASPQERWVYPVEKRRGMCPQSVGLKPVISFLPTEVLAAALFLLGIIFINHTPAQDGGVALLGGYFGITACLTAPSLWDVFYELLRYRNVGGAPVYFPRYN